MTPRLLFLLFVLAVFSPLLRAVAAPNILIIYADDIGYGDLACYGGTGVDTPVVDRLAREGVRHRSGYSTAATCTPSRFSLLTGEYAFRNRAARILEGNAPLIIDPARPNLPSLLRDAGYATSLVGKWHLGLGAADQPLDWNARITPGPLDLGFTEAFFMASTADRVPSVFIDGDRIRGLDPADPVRVSYAAPVGDEPTGISHPHLLRVQADTQHSGTIVNGISRIGTMTGGHAARFEDESLTDTFLAAAVDFIETEREQPFFMYFAVTENHVPRMPHPRFQGSSSLGVRGDAIAQFDWTVGRLVEALERQGLRENTLIILTSDNGPVLFDGYSDGAKERNGDHRPAGPYRGGKYSALEGGTRAPLIVNWPTRVQPGVSDAMISQVDLMASLTALVGVEVPPTAGQDGENVLPALLGESAIGREEIVQQSPGSLAIRIGDWKYLPPGRQAVVRSGIDARETQVVAPPGALFYLPEDPAELNDLGAVYPQILQRLRGRLETISGRKIGRDG